MTCMSEWSVHRPGHHRCEGSSGTKEGGAGSWKGSTGENGTSTESEQKVWVPVLAPPFSLK